jgi:hypothetical protein
MYSNRWREIEWASSSLREQLPQKNKRMEVSILFDVSRKRKREYQIKYNIV